MTRMDSLYAPLLVWPFLCSGCTTDATLLSSDAEPSSIEDGYLRCAIELQTAGAVEAEVDYMTDACGLGTRSVEGGGKEYLAMMYLLKSSVFVAIGVELPWGFTEHNEQGATVGLQVSRADGAVTWVTHACTADVTTEACDDANIVGSSPAGGHRFHFANGSCSQAATADTRRLGASGELEILAFSGISSCSGNPPRPAARPPAEAPQAGPPTARAPMVGPPEAAAFCNKYEEHCGFAMPSRHADHAACIEDYMATPAQQVCKSMHMDTAIRGTAEACNGMPSESCFAIHCLHAAGLPDPQGTTYCK